MNTVLELRWVTKRYGLHTAVDGVSLSIGQGEFFSLIGPSGCGKTTTLRLIAGFEEATSGAVILNGADATHVPPHRRDVSTVFQNYALFPHLTVRANVAFGLDRRPHISRGEAETRVREMLDLLQLSGKEDRLPKQLSGGERQRVALARSLVLRPLVLLLDEPLSALDPKLRRHVRAELKALQERVGVAFLFVTHDQEEALALSDRIGIMQGGKLLEVGFARELYCRPRTRFAAEFLGDVNWMERNIGVRPEALQLCANSLAEGPRMRPGVVEQVEFLGSTLRVRTRLEGGALCMAEMAVNGFIPVPQQTVLVTWHEKDEMSGMVDG